jgi:CubicO group peptidase (beta-lactamase class C family)
MPGKLQVYLIIAGFCMLAIFLSLIISGKSKFSVKQWRPLVNDDQTLTHILTEVIGETKQPAMGGALIIGENIIVKSTVGSAIYKENLPVDMNSRFHIGSITKSMTALLIAILTAENKLSYDMTLEQALPEIPMLDEYRHVTLHNLLLNQAGIIAFQQMDFEDPKIVAKLWEDIPAQWPDPTKQREQVAKLALSLKPIANPGEKAVYSNVGWAIAGLIAEKAAGQSYETLLQQRIFEPLGMNTARVGGWPASEGEPSQPRGHYGSFLTKEAIKPQPLNDAYTFPAWMNPSGGVHCSIIDFSLYAQENLIGLQGRGKLLSLEGYQTIHSVQLTAKLCEMYVNNNKKTKVTMGYGWVVIPEEGSLLSVADGSGGTFYARVIVFPPLNAAFAGFTNCGDGYKALDKVIQKITGFNWKT